jgi:spore coat polysaccharide biosynthesis protein SpsF (cytidylyltransferase family)
MRTTLESLYRKARGKSQREHLTKLVVAHTGKSEICFPPPDPSFDDPALRFDVNVQEDLNRLRNLVIAGVNFKSSGAQIVRLFREMPANG